MIGSFHIAARLRLESTTSLRLQIDVFLNLKHLVTMDALSVATFHSRFAFEQLPAVRTLEGKSHLQTWLLNGILARPLRLDRED